MLNTDYLDRLYADLTRADKQKLIKLLFGDSKQSMAYFHRTKDITLSKLELIADFFHVPLDALRVDSQYSFQVHSRKMSVRQEKSALSKLEEEVEVLRSRNKFLEQALELKTEKAEVLQMKLDLYKEQEHKTMQ